MKETSLILLALIALIVLPIQAYAHVGGGEKAEEILILSRYIKGNIELTTDPESQQWKQSFEKEIKSMWGHEISVKTLNNGTHVFFLLSWQDATQAKADGKEEADGASIIFEIAKGSEKEENKHEQNTQTKSEKEDVWYWSITTIEGLRNEGVTTKAEWEDGEWNALIGRQISLNAEDVVSFQTGIKKESFVKFAVWDGSKEESFEKMKDEESLHADFILLPEIEVYPKDVYVWTGILAGSVVVFLFVEQRLYKQKEVR